MKALTCAATRRRLHAFHDGELTVSEQIAVAAHLDWCDSCARALDEFQCACMIALLMSNHAEEVYGFCVTRIVLRNLTIQRCRLGKIAGLMQAQGLCE